MSQNGRYFKARINPAVLAVWAALLAVSRLLPSLPIVGTGSTFSVSAILTPLAGILFGPVPGMMIAAAGGFLGQLMAPHTAWMGIFTFLIGVVNAGCAGFVVYRKSYISLGVILLGGVLWMFHPIGREAWIYPAFYYGTGIITAVFTGITGASWITGTSRIKKITAVFTASYTGFVAASAYANYVGGLLVMQWPATMWKGLTLISPAERVFFSLGAVVIGVPLLFGLPKIGLAVGPGAHEDFQADSEA